MTAYGVVSYRPVAAGLLTRMEPADTKVYSATCAHVRAKTWREPGGADPGQAERQAMHGRTVRVRAWVRCQDKTRRL